MAIDLSNTELIKLFVIEHQAHSVVENSNTNNVNRMMTMLIMFLIVIMIIIIILIMSVKGIMIINSYQ